MQNINLLFNKLYYDGIEFKKKKDEIILKKIEEKRDSLIKSKFYEKDYQDCFIPGVSRLFFKILYPGLLIGTGYAHGVSCEGDAKLGFSFDYVTGQPYVPGSSVKGTIRGIFDDNELIKEIIKDKLDGKELDDKEIKDVINEIFDGSDIFLDAVIYCGDINGRVLGIDYITPHKEFVKNPVPIQMIKVLPNVIIEFRFLLKDGDYFTVDEKLKLFIQIIEDFGIGAKTNVGYGNLVYLNKKPVANYSICTDEDRIRESEAIILDMENSRCREVNETHNMGRRESFVSRSNNNIKNDNDKYTKNMEYYFEIQAMTGKKNNIAVCYCQELNCDQKIHPSNIRNLGNVRLEIGKKLKLKYLGLEIKDNYENHTWKYIDIQ